MYKGLCKRNHECNYYWCIRINRHPEFQSGVVRLGSQGTDYWRELRKRLQSDVLIR